jgi:hypothetical protein
MWGRLQSTVFGAHRLKQVLQAVSYCGTARYTCAHLTVAACGSKRLSPFVDVTPPLSFGGDPDLRITNQTVVDRGQC